MFFVLVSLAKSTEVTTRLDCVLMAKNQDKLSSSKKLAK